MKGFILYSAVALLLVLAGCSGSAPPEKQATPPVTIAPVQSDTLSDLSAPLAGQAQEDELSDDVLLGTAVAWAPRFVPTGLASGIMVEFTGVKKGKTLNAKFANIELRRYLRDTLSSEPGATPAPLSGPMKAQAPINNLHQAFFKVQPGTYFLRVTNPWADRKEIRDLIVHEGEYSVLSNDVYAAWLRRTQQPADSSGNKAQE